MTPVTPERLTFHQFFDDAAIFPPGLAPLETAISDHLARRGSLASMTGPLILGVADLPRAHEIAVAAGVHEERPLRISLVAPAAELDHAIAEADAVRPLLHVETLELRASIEARLWRDEIERAGTIDGSSGIHTVYIELSATQIAAGALAALSETPLRLKFRTGGIRPELFPSALELATTIVIATTLGVPFKLTAGLHEAVRYTSPSTGFTHHGFINIAVATALARGGASTATIEEILLDTDREHIANAMAKLDDSWRESFTTFGTCSVTEPVESLERLGLIHRVLSTTPAQETPTP